MTKRLSSKSKAIQEGNTWTPFYEEVAFWFEGGRGRWPRGRDCALVLGKVLRYCTLGHNTCWATVQRMADELRMSYRTVVRALEVLEANGLVMDLTPGRRYRAHEYQVDRGAIVKVVKGVRAMHVEAGLQYVGQSRIGQPDQYISVSVTDTDGAVSVSVADTVGQAGR